MMKKQFLRSKMVRRPTLQSVLTDKYCLRDTILVEGIFVRMYPDRARDLVCLGISNDNFIVARVIVTGYDIDFELISVSPLRRLDVNISKNEDKEINVTSAFKSPQLFQMCTSSANNQLWSKFVKCIEELRYARKDTWMDVELQIAAAAGGDHFANNHMYPTYKSVAERELADTNGSSAVLDTAFTTDIGVLHAGVDVEFDHFVNDDASSQCHIVGDQTFTQDTDCSRKGWRGLWLFRKILGRKKNTY